MNKVEPCPMCGRYDGDNKEKWEKRSVEINKMNLIVAGILFAEKSTTRQKEIFMAKYYLERETLREIADDFNISHMTAKEHLDNATDLLTDIIKHL